MLELKEAETKLKENNKLLINELQNIVEILQSDNDSKTRYIQNQKTIIEIQEKIINSLKCKSGKYE